MLKLAVHLLRRRLGVSAATLVALTTGVMILTAMGVLVQSGLVYKPTTQRYAAADAVVARPDITLETRDIGGETTSSTLTLPETGTVPAELAERIRQIPGVAASIADDSIPVFATGKAAAAGHGWSSAALTPYRLVAGVRPVADDEIVVDAALAGDALRPGKQAEFTVGGVTRRFRISGVAEQIHTAQLPPAVFFTDVRAAALSVHPGRVDAVGVVMAPGADRAAIVSSLDRLAAAAGAKAYAGSDLGLAERSGDRAARDLLIQAGGAFGGYVVLLIVFVAGGTIGLAVRHRRRELALLRAIAATPGQVRRLIAIEAGLLGVAAIVLGVPAGVPATGWVHDQLVTHGFLPATFPIAEVALAALVASVLTLLVAVGAALIAARRIARIRPTEALGEAAVEPARAGKGRFIGGLVTLAVAVGASFFTAGTGGLAALASAQGMLFLYVLAVAQLAPWINLFGAWLLAPALRTIWGASGYLATANLRANARGMAAVLTALVLSVGLGGSVWFLQDNLQRQTVGQSRDGMLAERALISPVGLSDSAVEKARKIPGVRAATGVRRTSVLVKIFGGDLQAVTAQAVDPDGVTSTMDLEVREGSLAGLHGAAIAVSGLQASTSGWKVGEQVELWLGDGTPVQVRVVAIYDRGLGFGDVTLTRDLVAGHTATNLDDQVLIRTAPGADEALAALARQYPGSTVVPATQLTGTLAEDLAVSAWLNKLLIGVMVGYAALAAANTMVIAALARRRELSVLRLVGATPRQIKRMVHAEQTGLLSVGLTIGAATAALTLTAVVNAVIGHPAPYVPPLGWAVVLGGTTLLALFTTVLPVGRLLRLAPVESIGIKE
ncbi:FtsX-like permease family protein [Actinoplanes sp. KI2]|uniref:FtsX-like permease family protein n=1 Tax=Actinoplanes sp. KI2 TaxID=2983315 RepID=UPI0021D578C9|nr:FtsX-like permease family protein [Actinoplanes sp. KI2]MCU7728382.1 FtsX-like permease family protein [Actinoplanes sp. KI2]